MRSLANDLHIYFVQLWKHSDKIMVKPLQEVSFFPIGGMWQSAEGLVLADFLALYDIIIDDRTQFARLYDYERKLSIWYRAGAGRVRITIWRLGNQ